MLRRFTYPQQFACSDGWSDPDVLLSSVPPLFPAATVGMYHRNNPDNDTDYFNSTLINQGLGTLLEDGPYHIPNPFHHLQFGAAIMGGDGWARASPSTLVTRAPVMAATLTLVALTEASDTPDDWVTHLAAVPRAGAASRGAHEAWWASFWNRSFVDVTVGSGAGNASLATVASAYEGTRYVQTIQSRTPWPIRFNGESARQGM